VNMFVGTMYSLSYSMRVKAGFLVPPEVPEGATKFQPMA